MDATIVDLRYKMNDVLKALDRNEKVNIKYRGKIKGILIPGINSEKKSLENHKFFGMNKDDTETVEQVMENLRGSRY